MKKISIVIVTYNSGNLIDDCLKSIFENNDIGNWLEVIIVDNCSRDSEEFLSRIVKAYPFVVTIQNEKNGGYGQGNNVGIRMASAPIILIMNPDVRLLEPIFSRAIEYFENDRLVLLGMKQWKSLFHKSRSFILDSFSVNPIFMAFFTNMANKLNLFIAKFMYIEGACFFLRKKDFFEIGLFDENIFMYGEEIDIKRRFFSSIQKPLILFDKKMKYLHLIGDRKLSEKAEMRITNSKMYLCDKFSIDIHSFLKSRLLFFKLLYVRSLFGNKKDLLIIARLIDDLKKHLIHK